MNDSNSAAENRQEPLLKVENLRTTFDTPRGALTAVDGVSFGLGRAETLGLVGESGSGKSVLVRSIMNLLGSGATFAPDSKVTFDGRDVHRLSPWEAKHFWGAEMAMVFQDPMTSLNPVRRIGVQLTESMRFHLGMSKREATARAVELLDQVRIPEPRKRLTQYPHELSGGMRQRVMIAIALACKPRLLVADEPTTALDVTVQKQILELLTGLQRELEMAMILITHDLGVVSGHTDRVAVMYAGQLVEVADTGRLFDSVRHPYTGALLDSIPRLEDPSHTRLNGIDGWPPDLIEGTRGCRFAPRCRYATDDCLETEPRLLDAEDSEHLVRCHFPLGSTEFHRAVTNTPGSGRTAAGRDLTAGAR